MADEQPKLPEGDKEEDKFSEFYQTAEQYEAFGNELEIQIREIKSKIRKDLQDEFARIEYLLNERERAIVLKEIELKQREADLNAREERLRRLELLESTPSPKVYGDEGEENLSDIEFEEDAIAEAAKAEAKRKSYEGGRNKEGVGGLPGSKLSTSIVIDRGKYQGDRVNLENGNNLVWNVQSQQYDDEFIPGPDASINANKGLKFTYFAVEAAYLNEGYDNPNYPHLYSQTILGKQVWYERTPRNRKEDNIGPQFGGRVPLNVLEEMLNKAVNTRVFTSDGNYIEFQSFRRAYKNWRIKYERGTYYKTANNELYSILEKDSQVMESHGNPPSYRTDGNLKSPTYGQRVAVSTDEKNRWSGFSGDKKKRNKKS